MHLNRSTRNNPTLALALKAERHARRHLKRNRYKVLATNAILPAGEADIVALTPDRTTLVIIEVKARRLPPDAPPTTTRRPEDALTTRKLNKLKSLARQLIKHHNLPQLPLRIDAIALDYPPLSPTPNSNPTPPSLLTRLRTSLRPEHPLTLRHHKDITRR